MLKPCLWRGQYHSNYSTLIPDWVRSALYAFSENTLRQVETRCLSIGFGAMKISFKSESLISLSDSKRYNCLRCAHFATCLTPSSSKISSSVFLLATNCEYFSTDEHNQKANVYYLQLTKFSRKCRIYFKKKTWITRLPLHIIAFTSAGTDVMAWTVNSVCSNKKAVVNFQIGINPVRYFGPPLRHINIIPSTVWASRDGLSTDLLNSCLPWYSIIFFINTSSRRIMFPFWLVLRVLNIDDKKDFSLIFETFDVIHS